MERKLGATETELTQLKSAYEKVCSEVSMERKLEAVETELTQLKSAYEKICSEVCMLQH